MEKIKEWIEKKERKRKLKGLKKDQINMWKI